MRKFGAGLGLVAGAAAAALAWPSAAAADDATQANLGAAVDVGGGQMWTVTDLRQSADVIPYQPAGTLWEATATVAPAAGGVPVVPGFTARSGGDSYPVLWPVATALGVNPSALPAGGSTTGKLYFDVVGAPPASVAYSADGRDTAMWVQPPPPPPAAPGYSAPAPAMSAPAAAPLPQVPAPASVPAPVAPAAPATAPAPAAGSSGTPLAETGSAGTPLPPESAASPAEGSSGTPATAEASPSPAAASPAPISPSPAAPSVAPTTPAPAEAGSSGTPLTAPTTTAVTPAG